MFQIANKSALLLLLFIPALIMWKIFLDKRGKKFILFSSNKLLPGKTNSIKYFIIKNLKYLKMIPLFLFIVALSRPQILNYFDIEHKKGIDILITLDTSGSMASLDFQPMNRLEVAKEVIKKFIKKRKSDRIGLVIFAGSAYTKCPLTLDYDLLESYLNSTKIGELEDGTALGMALATSVNRIKSSKSRTKIIILLTDGINNRGEITPKDAAKIAKDFGIKVYTIGVGKRGQAPFPISDSMGRKRTIMVEVEIDENILREISNSTGGIYFRATGKESLNKIFSEINKWEKSDIQTRRLYNRHELFSYFIFAGFFILLIIEILKRSILSVLP